jgi:serine/threonine-protein kinase RsbT
MEPLVCVIQREGDIYVAMSRGRDAAAEVGFDAIDRARIDIVILELARNLIMHAQGGQIRFSLDVSPTWGVGLTIESIDHGPGIIDIAQALQDGFSTSATLGAGLPGVRRLMDEFRIESQVGAGTYICTTRWLQRQI